MISSLIIGCKKIADEEYLNPEKENILSRNPDANCNLSTTICEDCVFQEQNIEDTASTVTILGDVFNNPYSLQVMMQAYNNLYNPDISSITTSHYYVRFKPNSASQLNILDSLDVELYDYPLNRHVIQDGDYWPEAYNNTSESGAFPWLYSVVESGFQYPSGITYEIIESLFIPADMPELEDEAYYITGNMNCDSTQYLKETRPAIIEQNLHTPYDPCDIPNSELCGGGGGGGTTSTLKPHGMINFQADAGPQNIIGASAPLKFVRIVGKRFFKIDKTYTDANGNFQLSKRFPRKVTIVVKLKTSVAMGKHSVRIHNHNIAVWNSMFPLKKNIGTYKGNNLQNLNYQFQKGTTSTKRKTINWVAAVSFNTAHESRDFLAINSLIQLPTDVRIHLYARPTHTATPQFDMVRRSSAPLLNQNRWLLNELWNYGGTSILGTATLFTIFAAPPLAPILLFATFAAAPQYPDIYVNYRTDDVNSITASKISFVTAQQLGIAYLDQVDKSNNINGKGIDDYIFSIGYVKARYPYDTYAPFGNGLDVNEAYHKELIAIWQTFAQHFGHIVTDRFYGVGSSEFSLQGKQWVSDFTKSSNLKYLEEFDPSITAPVDYFGWIPIGIINDLMDSNNEPLSTGVVDNVSGFTYMEIQSALLNKPSTLLEFKNLLKNIKPSQSTQIDQLFTSYGY